MLPKAQHASTMEDISKPSEENKQCRIRVYYMPIFGAGIDQSEHAACQKDW